MVKPFRWVVAVVAVLMCGSALAILPKGQTWRDHNYYSGWQPSKLAACADGIATVSALVPDRTYTTVVCDTDSGNRHYIGCTVTATGQACSQTNSYTEPGPIACPSNSTEVSGGCQCAAGYVESGGSCVPNQCGANAGKASTISLTIGWARTSDVKSTSPLVNASPPPASICSGGCTQDIDATAVAPGLGAYVSQTPTDQGLYRVSADFVAKNSGASCTPSTADAAANPAAPPPPCPGYVGEIDGKKGCYGTAQAPVITSPNPLPSNIPVDAGNPAAGPKPATGEGSGSGGAGRTPATGSGTAAGGPAEAAAGAKAPGAGTGTVAGQSQGTGRVGTQAGTEQANCGAPGQSPCKIDETGTPQSGDFTSATKTLSDAQTDALKQINDKVAEPGPTGGHYWSFTFQFPTGCTPLDTHIGGVIMDVCQWQGMIHDLLSMIWVAVTAMACISMVGRTIHGVS